MKQASISSFPLYGWAFLLSWVFCLFYSGSMDGFGLLAIGTNWSLASLAIQIAPLFFAIVSLGVSIAIEKRTAALFERKATILAISAIACISTPAFFVFTPNTPFGVMALIVAGSASGASSGLLWLMWTGAYSRLPQEKVEHFAPVSTVFAAFLSLIVTVLPGWTSVITAAALPLLAGLCLLGSQVEIASLKTSTERWDGTARASVPKQSKPIGRICFGILSIGFFASIEGSFWTPSIDTTPLASIVLFGTSIACTVAMSVFVTTVPRRVTMPFLFRWSCPLLAAGFSAIIVFGSSFGYFIAMAVSFSVRFAICLITQMHFSRYASEGLATPVRACGIGWIFIHSGDLLGAIIAYVFRFGSGAEMETAVTASAVLLTLLVGAFTFVIGNSSGFLEAPFPSVPRASKVPPILSEKTDGKNSEVAQDSIETTIAERTAILASQFGLTPRETEVFELLARGRSAPYIRDALVISKNTTATHTKRIYAKLGVHSRQELIDLVDANEA